MSEQYVVSSNQHRLPEITSPLANDVRCPLDSSIHCSNEQTLYRMLTPTIVHFIKTYWTNWHTLVRYGRYRVQTPHTHPHTPHHLLLTTLKLQGKEPACLSKV